MKNPNIRAGDVHFVVNAKTNRLKCFDSNGKMKWMVEAHTQGTNGNYQNFQGDTPPGLYTCGEPDNVLPTEPGKTQASFGPWFVPLNEQERQMSRWGRAGIGVHGGGSGLSNPYFAARQGWVPTHGCIRLQNEDLIRFAHTVIHVRRRNRTAWLSVYR